MESEALLNLFIFRTCFFFLHLNDFIFRVLGDHHDKPINRCFPTLIYGDMVLFSRLELQN